MLRFTLLLACCCISNIFIIIKIAWWNLAWVTRGEKKGRKWEYTVLFGPKYISCFSFVQGTWLRPCPTLNVWTILLNLMVTLFLEMHDHRHCTHELTESSTEWFTQGWICLSVSGTQLKKYKIRVVSPNPEPASHEAVKALDWLVLYEPQFIGDFAGSTCLPFVSVIPNVLVIGKILQSPSIRKIYRTPCIDPVVKEKRHRVRCCTQSSERGWYSHVNNQTQALF